jgi:LmbE family N-acetylglucosaminyl deacetylase
MTILVIAPHADDETLGMGGSIARFATEGKHVVVAVLTGPGDEPHPLWPASTWDEIRAEAAHAMKVLGVADLIFENLPAACLDRTPDHVINETVSDVIARVQPHELYIPYLHDLHKDHLALSYAALVHSRGYLAQARGIELLAMYETPTETHLFPAALQPPFVPNMWVDVSATIEAKLEAWSCYRSQQQKGRTPRSPEALRALALTRGAEIGAESAEGFLVLRIRR